ncbi:hypothetical protein V1514DRAFT_330947 [Lipomyces japonicus]|uniref:uncharacterized protein n=1 Tax=Lipomyces japonicus TaxID=56871 RepID=UPI0034CFD0E3
MRKNRPASLALAVAAAAAAANTPPPPPSPAPSPVLTSKPSTTTTPAQTLLAPAALQLITPPEEYVPLRRPRSVWSSTSSASYNNNNNEADNDDDNDGSVAQAESLLRRNQVVVTATEASDHGQEIFLDPEAFADSAADSSLASVQPPASPSSSSSTRGRALLKKIVPSKLRLNLKRRMSAPITSSFASFSPLTSSQQQPQQQIAVPSTRDSYFDLHTPSSTNLETPNHSVTTSSTPRSSSRHSLLLPVSGIFSSSDSSSPFSVTTPASGTQMSNSASGTGAQSIKSASSVLISSAVLSASAAMTAVISGSPPIPPSPLSPESVRNPPDLSEIRTPLSPTPISQHVSQCPSPRPTSSLPSSSATTPFDSHSSMLMNAYPSSSSSGIQQLHQRLQQHLQIQDITDNTIRSSTFSSSASSSASLPVITATTGHEDLKTELVVLQEQMRLEDQAFAATEDRLEQSGWTSDQDLQAIRTNRIATRRKWEIKIARVRQELHII